MAVGVLRRSVSDRNDGGMIERIYDAVKRTWARWLISTLFQKLGQLCHLFETYFQGMLHSHRNHYFMELKWHLWKINQFLWTMLLMLSPLITPGLIKKGGYYLFKHWGKNNGLKMLVGTWECYDPWNTSRKKQLFIQRKRKSWRCSGGIILWRV